MPYSHSYLEVMFALSLSLSFLFQCKIKLNEETIVNEAGETQRETLFISLDYSGELVGDNMAMNEICMIIAKKGKGVFLPLLAALIA